MRYTIGAGRYFGIPVRIHFTFPLILIVFGAEAWTRGGWVDALHAVVLTLAVFVCVVLHEFGHSLQVLRYGIPVRDIVLLPIGGMARMERIPENPWQEIIVAISGPLVNFALAALLFGVLMIRGGLGGVDDFVTQLLAINLILGVFNLIPAFPMDGGRILRGLLAVRLPYLKATRIARAVGQVIAILFVIVGFMNSSFVMLPVIGVFVFIGAMNEERALRVRHILMGRTVGDLARDAPAPLLDTDPLDAASAVLEGHGGEAVAVTDASGELVALSPAVAIRSAVRQGRGSEPLGRYLSSDFAVLRADMPAVQAWYFLRSQRRRLAGVVSGDRFVGVVHIDSFLDDSRA